jgi:hypothetical protein
MGELRVTGFFAAAKMTHLSDDEIVAKMGTRRWLVWSDVDHPSAQTIWAR